MKLSERLRCNDDCLKDGAQQNLTRLWHSEVVRDAARDSREAADMLDECESVIDAMRQEIQNLGGSLEGVITADELLARTMDLKQHLIRQMAWSHTTFGPGERTKGVIDHIKKELDEVLDADGESSEWVDVVILALDGLTRRLAFANGERADPEFVADAACRMIIGKQTRNEARVWPDWRTMSPDKAIEHDRSNEQ